MPRKGHTEEQIIAALAAIGRRSEDERIVLEAGNQPGDVLLLEETFIVTMLGPGVFLALKPVAHRANVLMASDIAQYQDLDS
jgi:hypothetical protein